MRIFRVSALLVVTAMLMSACADMRGPRGYYVSEDDSKVFIEFLEKPRAQSNIISELGVREYTFSAYDTEIDLYAPDDVNPRRRWDISGESERIRITELPRESHSGGPPRYFRLIKTKEAEQARPEQLR